MEVKVRDIAVLLFIIAIILTGTLYFHWRDNEGNSNFIFNEKVLVKRGFYAGTDGVILDYASNHIFIPTYFVRLENGQKAFIEGYKLATYTDRHQTKKVLLGRKLNGR